MPHSSRHSSRSGRQSDGDDDDEHSNRRHRSRRSSGSSHPESYPGSSRSSLRSHSSGSDGRRRYEHTGGPPEEVVEEDEQEEDKPSQPSFFAGREGLLSTGLNYLPPPVDFSEGKYGLLPPTQPGPQLNTTETNQDESPPDESGESEEERDLSDGTSDAGGGNEYQNSEGENDVSSGGSSIKGSGTSNDMEHLAKRWGVESVGTSQRSELGTQPEPDVAGEGGETGPTSAVPPDGQVEMEEEELSYDDSPPVVDTGFTGASQKSLAQSSVGQEELNGSGPLTPEPAMTGEVHDQVEESDTSSQTSVDQQGDAGSTGGVLNGDASQSRSPTTASRASSSSIADDHSIQNSMSPGMATRSPPPRNGQAAFVHPGRNEGSEDGQSTPTPSTVPSVSRVPSTSSLPTDHTLDNGGTEYIGSPKRKTRPSTSAETETDEDEIVVTIDPEPRIRKSTKGKAKAKAKAEKVSSAGSSSKQSAQTRISTSKHPPNVHPAPDMRWTKVEQPKEDVPDWFRHKSRQNTIPPERPKHVERENSRRPRLEEAFGRPGPSAARRDQRTYRGWPFPDLSQTVHRSRTSAEAAHRHHQSRHHRQPERNEEESVRTESSYRHSRRPTRDMRSSGSGSSSGFWGKLVQSMTKSMSPTHTRKPPRLRLPLSNPSTSSSLDKGKGIATGRDTATHLFSGDTRPPARGRDPRKKTLTSATDRHRRTSRRDVTSSRAASRASQAAGRATRLYTQTNTSKKQRNSSSFARLWNFNARSTINRGRGRTWPPPIGEKRKTLLYEKRIISKDGGSGSSGSKTSKGSSPSVESVKYRHERSSPLEDLMEDPTENGSLHSTKSGRSRHSRGKGPGGKPKKSKSGNTSLLTSFGHFIFDPQAKSTVMTSTGLARKKTPSDSRDKNKGKDKVKVTDTDTATGENDVGPSSRDTVDTAERTEKKSHKSHKENRTPKKDKEHKDKEPRHKGHKHRSSKDGEGSKDGKHKK